MARGQADTGERTHAHILMIIIAICAYAQRLNELGLGRRAVFCSRSCPSLSIAIYPSAPAHGRDIHRNHITYPNERDASLILLSHSFMQSTLNHHHDHPHFFIISSHSTTFFLSPSCCSFLSQSCFPDSRRRSRSTCIAPYFLLLSSLAFFAAFYGHATPHMIFFSRVFTLGRLGLRSDEGEDEEHGFFFIV
jgi:hypothetical protein